MCVHQHFADTTPFFFFFVRLCVSLFFFSSFLFGVCAVTVAAGQRLYSHHRQNFIATAVAAALPAEARLSLLSSVAFVKNSQLCLLPVGFKL